jgi:hypothetical protein
MRAGRCPIVWTTNFDPMIADARARVDPGGEALDLGVPVGVIAVGGLDAQRNATRATTAATMLTTDSAASESSPPIRSAATPPS